MENFRRRKKGRERGKGERGRRKEKKEKEEKKKKGRGRKRGKKEREEEEAGLFLYKYKGEKEEIDFSKKRDKITVKVYREDLESKLWIATDTTRFCFFYQMLNGENINDINVKLTVLDAGTGSILSSQDWPKTDNNITQNQYDGHAIK